MKGKIFSCDYETNNDADNCRVWAWEVLRVGAPGHWKGTELEECIQLMQNQNNGIFYFHNLKFDGGFIVPYLLKHGFTWTAAAVKDMEPCTFNTLISGLNVWYSMAVKWSNGNTCRIIDSLKLISIPLAAFHKTFGMEESKGEIDYNLPRPPGYQPTEAEWDYLHRDVVILAKGLEFMLGQGLNKMTQGSNALERWKGTQKEWKKLLPEIREYDMYLRPAYKGGYCIVAPGRAMQDIGEGEVYDRNSMYPAEMDSQLFPYGMPQYFKGRYQSNSAYPLFMQRFFCTFRLKPGYLPTVQIKNTHRFAATEYLTESGDEPVLLSMCDLDIETFFEHYDVDEDTLEWVDGFMFMGTYGLFSEFIQYWYKVKEDAARDGNAGLKHIAKIMLNSLYGKFGSRGEGTSKIPYLDEKGVVRYKNSDIEERKLVYLPIAMWTTAYARRHIITLGQANIDRLLYIDTDSLHLTGHGAPANMEIDPYKLGAWDKELEFTRARYLRAKSYIEDRAEGYYKPDKERSLMVKCAGLPSGAQKYVDWDNFWPGAEYEGKLQHYTVENGVILKETTFTLKL